MSVPLIEITRSGVVEEIHNGSIVVVKDNQIIYSVGNANVITPMRSTAKPFQLLSLIKNDGKKIFGLSDAEIALMVSSHNGEKKHLRILKDLLAKANIDETLINCGVHPAYFEWITEEVIRETGKNVTRLHNNCSGKHIGMLLLSKLLGYDYDGYWQETHPVQQMILKDISTLLGRDVSTISIGIDGCGVPTYNISLEELAKLYYKIAVSNMSDEDDALGVIANAMISENFMVAGSDRLDTDLMKLGKYVGKVGSQGIFCISIPLENVGIAIKVESGSENAAESVAVEVLNQLGMISGDDLQSLEKYWHRAIFTCTNIQVGNYTPVINNS